MAYPNLRRVLAHWRAFTAGAAAILAFIALSTAPAESRRYYGYQRHTAFHHSSYHRVVFHRRAARDVYSFRRTRSAPPASQAPDDSHAGEGGQGYLQPGFAAIVVDANTGHVLFRRNENELRHPASVTKVMTLYLLFERLEKGRLRLDSPLMISAHAASQAPSKLGLRPGETIDVENAIKAVVTKSANDIAVAIAENLGGDEATFARMMTRKAQALGMSRTHYANASGLPNPEQVTTAHDLAVLGRAIQDRFPRYYRYFSTHVFAYNGGLHRNHNHLLGRVEGVDGIKTGYTRASGFNLLTSVRRGSRHIVAVVLGGRTAAARDHAMTGLIEETIRGGAPVRTARAITEDQPAEDGFEPMQFAANESGSGEIAVDDGAPADEPIYTATIPSRRFGRLIEQADETAEAEDSPVPAPAKTTVRRDPPLPPPAAAPHVAPPAPAPVQARVEKARPAFVSGVQKAAEAPADRKPSGRSRMAANPPGSEKPAPAAADGSTSRFVARTASREGAGATTPSALRHVEPSRTQIAKADSARPARPGWMIQIGATPDVETANQLLSRARGQLQGASAGAKSFTEKVQKGNETLWRARFAGLEQQSAEAACRTLKRSGFSCFATKN